MIIKVIKKYKINIREDVETIMKEVTKHVLKFSKKNNIQYICVDSEEGLFIKGFKK